MELGIDCIKMIPFLTCLLKLLLMPRRRLFNGGCRAKEPVGAGGGCFYGRHFMDIIYRHHAWRCRPVHLSRRLMMERPMFLKLPCSMLR